MDGLWDSPDPLPTVEMDGKVYPRGEFCQRAFGEHRWCPCDQMEHFPETIFLWMRCSRCGMVAEMKALKPRK
jgi:hypothetical protein